MSAPIMKLNCIKSCRLTSETGEKRKYLFNLENPREFFQFHNRFVDKAKTGQSKECEWEKYH